MNKKEQKRIEKYRSTQCDREFEAHIKKSEKQDLLLKRLQEENKTETKEEDMIWKKCRVG